VSPQKILIIRLSAIGDILLATPLLRALRTQFPEARLDFVVKAEFADVLRYHPAIATLYELNTKNGLPELQTLGRRLREMRYEVIFDIHKNFRSRYLAYAAKPQKLFQYRKHIFRRWLLVHTKINLMRRVPPIYQRYLAAAMPLGIPPLPPLAGGRWLELFWREQEEREADFAILREARLPLIGLAPGAGYFTKRWPAEYFGQLAANLIRRNRQVVILGGAQEIALAQQIEKTVESMTGRREKIINLTGALSLLGSAAVIKRCQLLVANDSGLMHVAEAVGTPLLAIFGSTTAELGFSPQSPSSRVIENVGLSCRPCSHLGYAQCPRGHFRCMREILPDKVWAAAQEMLLQASTAPMNINLSHS
jgi:heptosyltransferase-2